MYEGSKILKSKWPIENVAAIEKLMPIFPLNGYVREKEPYKGSPLINAWKVISIEPMYQMVGQWSFKWKLVYWEMKLCNCYDPAIVHSHGSELYPDINSKFESIDYDNVKQYRGHNIAKIVNII